MARLLAAVLLTLAFAPAAHAWPTGKPTTSYSKTYQAHRFHCQLWLYQNGYVERCTIVPPRGAASARMLWNGEGSGHRSRLR